MSDENIVLALDVGERRIGVAIASMIARLPAPHSTLDRQKSSDIFADIEQLVRQESAGVIVVGLPRDMRGNETEQTGLARQFARDLQQKLGRPVVLQDEAATSIQAEERLKARGKGYTKADIDAEAAAIILQDFLAHKEQQTA